MGELSDLADQSRALEADARTKAAPFVVEGNFPFGLTSASREASTRRPVSRRHLYIQSQPKIKTKTGLRISFALVLLCIRIPFLKSDEATMTLCTVL